MGIDTAVFNRGSLTDYDISDAVKPGHGLPEPGLKPTTARVPAKHVPKYISYDNKRLDHVLETLPISSAEKQSIQLACRVFPFKVNDYVLNHLINWDNIPDDPMYRLLFPRREMLQPEDASSLEAITKREAGKEEITAEVLRIRGRMNPHPANQQNNQPLHDNNRLEGLQHKYKETLLFFPKQGQTCHSYCTFCFRWPQFVDAGTSKFESRDTEQLFSYLAANKSVSDLLITGGDPMVMNTRRLSQFFDMLVQPELDHVQTLRLGTKALTYWPYRFFADRDSSELLNAIKTLVDRGKHVAIMAHINHWRELEPEPARTAINALRSAGAAIRSQAPVLRYVNDDPDTWSQMWKMQVQLGICPYYMFVERDTGAHHYFSVPLARAHQIYEKAISKVSGLARTARGPVMSADPGKVQVLGSLELKGETYFLLTMLQARQPELANKPFLAKYSETATWLDDLEPPDGIAFPFPHTQKTLAAPADLRSQAELEAVENV